MSFNFDDLLSQGKSAADAVVQNREEIQEVLDLLETSLSNFLQIQVSLSEETAYEDDGKPEAFRMVNILGVRKKADYNYLYLLHNETGIKTEIARLKRSKNGYPITIIFGKRHDLTDNQDDFAASLGTVVSDSQTHLRLRQFMEDIDTVLN